jgi:hypothetical protein
MHDRSQLWRAVDRVPDFGEVGLPWSKILTKTKTRFCINDSDNGMTYRIEDPLERNCATFHPGGNGDTTKPFYPFAAALYFRPETSYCPVYPATGDCTGGQYRLNVAPGPNDVDGNLHVSAGSESGNDQQPAGPSIGDAIINAFAKEAEKRQKEEQAAKEMRAGEAVPEEARAGARVRQNVCISDDLTTEWRNPSAGGKMAALKRLLTQSLRERANSPGYDQTRWIAVDSRYYSAWNPDTSSGWSALVSTIPGGSCGAASHREILPLAP